jgi:hypothetical protein
MWYVMPTVTNSKAKSGLRPLLSFASLTLVLTSSGCKPRNAAETANAAGFADAAADAGVASPSHDDASATTPDTAADDLSVGLEETTPNLSVGFDDGTAGANPASSSRPAGSSDPTGSSETLHSLDAGATAEPSSAAETVAPTETNTPASETNSLTETTTDAGAASTDEVVCNIGESASLATPDTVQLFGAITYYADGAVLDAGRYRVTYVDGCMKYSAGQDWALHAYTDGSIAWYLGAATGDQAVRLPGTYGIFEGSGGYADFEACVAANLPLEPVEFDFAGGQLGVWVADSNYVDNVPGTDNRNPKWRLERLGACE